MACRLTPPLNHGFWQLATLMYHSQMSGHLVKRPAYLLKYDEAIAVTTLCAREAEELKR